MQLQGENITIQAARRCIELCIPFALYIFPDEDELHFTACSATRNVSLKEFFNDSKKGTFAIAKFHPSDSVEIINSEFSTDDVLKLERDRGLAVLYENPLETSFETYSLAGNKIIETLKANSGKVVMSRVIVSSGPDPVSVATEYFRNHPSTFRSLYFTPRMGLWLGATPEILAYYSEADKSLKTMSLAGTRSCDLSDEWDSKNTEEHKFVTDFITDILARHSDKITVSKPFALKYGTVEHLCEQIVANGISDISEVIEQLSPTPAVCGTPRNFALDAINKFESHSRQCYGGWLGVKCKDEVRAFVNLRCAKILCDIANNSYIYKIFAGGGFTSKSDINVEWEEASLKAASLLKILRGHSRIDEKLQ